MDPKINWYTTVSLLMSTRSSTSLRRISDRHIGQTHVGATSIHSCMHSEQKTWPHGGRTGCQTISEHRQQSRFLLEALGSTSRGRLSLVSSANPNEGEGSSDRDADVDGDVDE